MLVDDYTQYSVMICRQPELLISKKEKLHVRFVLIYSAIYHSLHYSVHCIVFFSSLMSYGRGVLFV
jgi:hypothetical protein